MGLQMVGNLNPISLGVHPALPGFANLVGGNGHLPMPMAPDGNTQLLGVGAHADSMFALGGLGASNRMGAHTEEPAKIMGDASKGRPGEEWGLTAKVRADDWNVVYNPAVTTMMKMDLLHTLDHESVVCCVRFSNNGQYIATG